jgi:hypothetical protein
MNNLDRIYCIYTLSNLTHLGGVFMIHIEYGKNEV